MNHKYSILIQWFDDDQKYIVSLPEFGPYAHTHGNTYEEALKNGQEVLELLIEDYQEKNKPLPKPELVTV
ncbi:MAG: type II toxin-antitoxin system HicB family antitoxin [Cyanobacterium sp. T60_A2020_053]|nr:type II toxin-antitoxin system HicB family antitoxin [Cyanobacterium sp. T60_A2020_053]